MLAKIEISNFKNFKENFVFDLSNTSSFSFNQECIKNKIVNKAIVYGHNGSGKSNLGFAIFDLISHITDKEIVQDYYKNYFNADLNETKSKFSFEFRFDKNILEYSYTKSDYQTLISEELKINGKEYLYIDREKSSIFRTSAKGAKSLKKDIKFDFPAPFAPYTAAIFNTGSFPSSIVIWFDKVVLFMLGNISNWTSSLNERKFFSITRSIIFLSTIVR